MHPGLLAEIPGIKLTNNLDEGSHDSESSQEVFQAREPGTTDIMYNLAKRVSIAWKSDNLAQKAGVSDSKDKGVKNVQNYNVEVKDVYWDSKNEEWDNKNPP